MAHYGDDDLEKNSLPNQSLLSDANRKSTTKKYSYGSVRTEPLAKKSNLVNYRHKLESGETLPGISLKYGVPIENIKRANRLWSNDLAFLKDFIVIPIDRDKLRKEFQIEFDELGDPIDPSGVNISLPKLSESLSKVKLNSFDSIGSQHSNQNNNNNHNHHNRKKNNHDNTIDDDHNNNVNTSSNDKSDKEKLQSYLTRFDSFISESKEKLKTLESTANIAATDYLGNGFSNRSGDEETTTNRLHTIVDCDQNEPLVNANDATRRTKKKTNSNASSSSNLSSNESYRLTTFKMGKSSSGSNLMAVPDHLVVKTSPNKYMNLNTNSSTSRSRMAEETLERLEKEKDDLFEL